jgi:hypothetical protein
VCQICLWSNNWLSRSGYSGVPAGFFILSLSLSVGISCQGSLDLVNVSKTVKFEPIRSVGAMPDSPIERAGSCREKGHFFVAGEKVSFLPSCLYLRMVGVANYRQVFLGFPVTFISRCLGKEVDVVMMNAKAQLTKKFSLP